MNADYMPLEQIHSAELSRIIIGKATGVRR